ncbi:MAG: sigma-70 family RNA polymerase sigma factor [Agriterribacter sp.]
MANPKSVSDFQLLEDLQTNEKQDDAIRKIYREYYRLSAYYVTQNSGTESDAQDIFQEVLVAFIELVRDGRFRGECSISTFLYTLTRNMWINELGKRDRSKVREEKFEVSKEKVDFDFGQLIEGREARKILSGLLQQLGETCQKILLAFYYHNLPMKEILQTLDYQNEQVVRNKKYKCLKELEKRVTADSNLLNTFKSAYWHE